MILLKALASITLAATVVAQYNIKAWQSLSQELTIPEIKVGARNNIQTGISFSGGGSRAYIAALGYLAALHKLKLTQAIDYIYGISGYEYLFKVSILSSKFPSIGMHFSFCTLSQVFS